MSHLKLLAFSVIALALFAGAAPRASAQVAIGVGIGPEPGCPYGYFDYAPYDCSPYGYYGPDWFVGGVSRSRSLVPRLARLLRPR